MIIDEFQRFWRTSFPNCLPISYLFKSNLHELWFRVHSLPESKRYAENKQETQEIFRRQKILFKDLFNVSEECYIVCLGYDNQSPIEIYGEEFPIFAKLFTQESEPIPPSSIEEDREPDEFFRVVYGKHKIKFNDLKELLVAIANEEIVYFFIVSLNSKRIFAPYDGGVDVILESSTKRDEFKIKYRDWLSHRPDRL